MCGRIGSLKLSGTVLFRDRDRVGRGLSVVTCLGFAKFWNVVWLWRSAKGRQLRSRLLGFFDDRATVCALYNKSLKLTIVFVTQLAYAT